MNQGEADSNSNIKLTPVRRRGHSGTITVSTPSTETQHTTETATLLRKMNETEIDEFDFISSVELTDREMSFVSENSTNSPNINSPSGSNSIEMTTFTSTNDSDDEGIDDEDALLITKESGGGGDSHHEDNSKNKHFEAETKVMEHESFLSISVQVFIPFLIAGMGMVGAGKSLFLMM